MKLSANLVPLSLWGFNARNMPKEDWSKIKIQARKESKYHCVLCKKDMCENLYDLHTHEFWEYDEENHVATIIKIGTVCIDCHDIIHLGRTFAVNKGEKGMEKIQKLNKHFITVNGLSPSPNALQEERTRAMRDWRRRNLIKWTQNLSILRQYGVDEPMLDDEQKTSIRNDVLEKILETKK